MERQTYCANCVHFGSEQNGHSGLCRKNAPIPVREGLLDKDDESHAYWPTVRVDDWCGEHEPE